MINEIITNLSSDPTWLTEGRTILIYKKGDENQTKNYCLITCLSTLYKFITLLITERVYKHLTENEILAFEQKGCRKRLRGCKDQLLFDEHILELTRKSRRNASMPWIDYKNEYDSVPHSWIKEILTLYKIDPSIANFIKSSIPQWRTKIRLPQSNVAIELDDINIETGIFQGDTFLPLIFCLALTPLSNILKRVNIGVKMRKAVVSHLLYMDDLKALLSDIPSLDIEDAYKYLGISEASDILHTEIKTKATKEVIQQTRSILNANVTACNTTQAINAFTLPITYFAQGRRQRNH